MTYLIGWGRDDSRLRSRPAPGAREHPVRLRRRTHRLLPGPAAPDPRASAPSRPRVRRDRSAADEHQLGILKR